MRGDASPSGCFGQHEAKGGGLGAATGLVVGARKQSRPFGVAESAIARLGLGLPGVLGWAGELGLGWARWPDRVWVQGILGCGGPAELALKE